MSATGTFVVIPDRYTCRGLTFLPHGQQMTGSVPAGTYDVGGECDLCYTDLGVSKRGRAVPITNIDTLEKWYVGPAVALFLLKEHQA